MAFSGDNRDRRAAAQAMLWSPLHPSPDGASFTLDDRKIVVGVYPLRTITVTSGTAIGRRGRHSTYEGNAPMLLGQYIPWIDKSLGEI
jgi:hypothetical protein